MFPLWFGHGRLFPLSRLNFVLSHREWPLDPVEFVVEAAGVADGVAVAVPSPEGRDLSLAVRAASVGSQPGTAVLKKTKMNEKI